MIKIAKLHVDAVKQGIKKINYDKGKNITPVIVEDMCSNNKALFFPGGGGRDPDMGQFLEITE